MFSQQTGLRRSIYAGIHGVHRRLVFWRFEKHSDNGLGFVCAAFCNSTPLGVVASGMVMRHTDPVPARGNGGSFSRFPFSARLGVEGREKLLCGRRFDAPVRGPSRAFCKLNAVARTFSFFSLLFCSSCVYRVWNAVNGGSSFRSCFFFFVPPVGSFSCFLNGCFSICGVAPARRDVGGCPAVECTRSYSSALNAEGWVVD